MQISLGGPIGPNDGGLATHGGRTIQELQKVEMKKAIEPVRPPSAKAPEMIEPTKAPPKKTTPNKVEAKDPKSNRPTKGEEIQKGSSIAENKAKGQGFGLSSGGGGEGGLSGSRRTSAAPSISRRCAPVIMANWNSQQGAVGVTHLRFVIQRDGRIVDITVEQSSGVATLDLFARRALMLTKLPPLPEAYPENALPVHLYFRISTLRLRNDYFADSLQAARCNAGCGVGGCRRATATAGAAAATTPATDERRAATHRRPRDAAAHGGARSAGTVERQGDPGGGADGRARCCGTTSTTSASST